MRSGLVAIIFVIGVATSLGTPVAIPDPGLNKWIRSQLGKPEGVIDSSEMEALRFVNAWGVRDLTGIECAINATDISLSESMVTDLSPLSELVKLEELKITGSKELVDLEPLKGLENLTYLELQGLGITNLEPLSDITNLESLSIQNADLSDLSPLSELSKLIYLSLRNDKINNLEPLGSLENLNTLDLTENEIQSLEGLSSLLNLEWLGLDTNQISDLEPISNLTGLGTLSVRSNRISVIDVAAEMRISTLYMDDNLISDLDSLAEFGYTPSTLSLSRNYISDLEPIASARWITGGGLNISYNLLDLEEGGRQKLILDQMSEPTNGNFGPIVPVFLPQKGDEVAFGDPKLEEAIRFALDQGEGPVKVVDLESLVELEAEGEGISNLSGLEHAFNLTRIDLSGNHLTRPDAILDLPSLLYLDLSYNQIDGLGFSKWENTIEYIDLRNNFLFGVENFMSFPHLGFLDVTCNPIHFLDNNKNGRQLAFIEEAFDTTVVSGGDCYELGKLHWKVLDSTGERLLIWLDNWELQYSSNLENWESHFFYDRSKIYQVNQSQAKLIPLTDGSRFWRVRSRD